MRENSVQATTAQAKPKVRGEKFMWGCVGACLLAGLAAPLFGSNPMGIAVPCLMAVVLGCTIVELRREAQKQQNR